MRGIAIVTGTLISGLIGSKAMAITVNLSTYCTPNDGLNDSACILNAMSAVKTAGLSGEIYVDGVYDFTSYIKMRDGIYFNIPSGGKLVKRFNTTGENSLFSQWTTAGYRYSHWGVYGSGTIEAADGYTGVLASFFGDTVYVRGITFSSDGGGFAVTNGASNAWYEDITITFRNAGAIGDDGWHVSAGDGVTLKGADIYSHDDCIGVSGAMYLLPDQPINNGLVEDVTCTSTLARVVHIGQSNVAFNGPVKNWTFRNISGTSGSDNDSPGLLVEDRSTNKDLTENIRFEDITIDTTLADPYDLRFQSAHNVTYRNVVNSGTINEALFQSVSGADTLNWSVDVDYFTNARFGTTGNDTLIAAEMGEFIGGMEGDDVLYAGPGNDTIAGGFGDDTIHGGPGVNVLRGQAGADVFYVDGDDTITDFEEGVDTRIDL